MKRKILYSIAYVVLSTTGIAQSKRTFNGIYSGEQLSRVAFPIGGIGAGMFTLEGTGTVSHLSIRHRPEMFNEPNVFAAICIKGIMNGAKVLEGTVPDWKKFGQHDNARGAEGTTFGLARFSDANFKARFPFGEVRLNDKTLPLAVIIKGWSPFIPTDADNSSLPVGALEYTFTNTGKKSFEYIFSYNAENCLALQDRRDTRIRPELGVNHIDSVQNGFVLVQDSSTDYPEYTSSLAFFTDEKNTTVDYCWFRGGWWDPLSMAWNKIRNGNVAAVSPVEKNAPGASLSVPFTLAPGKSKTIKVMIAWYTPQSKLRSGVAVSKASDSVIRDASVDLPSPYYQPWYCSRFKNIHEVISYWKNHYATLRHESALFTDAFYKSTLPPEVTEAVAANLTILKSPTVLRQYDGRFWGWEGSNDNIGSCAGTCTHVWNYAQALPHVFPSLERSIRETELNENLDAYGHQNYRGALPIRPSGHQYYFPAADGQLGSIMRVHRDWRIGGDSNWLRTLYPKIKLSLDYCIATWDPRHSGTLEEPHHNTYDIEFWGANGMTTSFYLGALQAMVAMGNYLREDVNVYAELLQKGKQKMERELFNGEYFRQNIQWTGLRALDPVLFSATAADGGETYSPEAEALLKKEGPKYQYGNGCLSDGVIGAWMAKVCGLPDIVDTTKVRSHLLSVYKYNLKKDLSEFSNPQRPSFALGKEGGLLLCTWPKGGQLSLPFVYSNEVWTGIEYEVASHLIFQGQVKQGLDIVRTARRRYDGTVRNPFDEYECGHWYARAMSSYALIEALTGVRYDAVEKTLYVDSRVGDFVSFISTNTGFGNVEYKKGKVTVKVVYGTIDVQKIKIAKGAT